MKLILPLILCALLAGSASAPTPPIAITVPDKKPEAVRNATMLYMTERNWQPIHADQFMLEFTKEMPFGAQIFLQEIGGQPAQHSYRFTFIEVPTGTRFLGNSATITTRFGAPQRSDNWYADNEVMYTLECIRATLLGEAMPPPPLPPPGRKSPYGKFNQK